jgi:hypothetical protein
VDAGLERLHRVALVVDRRRRAGEVEDEVRLDVQRHRDVVAHHLEHGVREQLRHVAARTGVVVVDDEHLMALVDQAFAQVRPDEPRSAGDHDTHDVPPRDD